MLARIANMKIWVRLVASIGGMLLIAWGIMLAWTAYQQREMALQLARDMASSVHQITMANLLFMKVTKTIKKRSLFYEQVRQSEVVRDLRVLRGEPVIHEMGDGDEIAMNPDELEKQVMKEGKTVFQEVDDPKHGHVLRAVFPTLASKNYLGKNCMECHEEAKEGQILGAVSMKIRLADVDATIRNAEIALFVAANLITLPLLVFIYFFVRQTVTRPLTAMTERLQSISQGEGDLTQRLPVHGQDEIGQASIAFNQMMDKLRSLIRRVRDISSDVTVSAQDLQENSYRISNTSAAQTDRSITTASAMEEMAASIASVAAASGEVEQLSAESQSRASAGAANMGILQQRIDEVEHAVSGIAGKVENFVNQTASITRMTQQFKYIAEQTNLLAPIAAIEAARAGEHGRGFAVVADEVRKLAEKSAQSANEIDAITRALGGESGQVRSAIDQGLKVLATSHESMLSVATVLRDASETVNKVAQGMGGIRSATEEQKTASAMVAGNVETIAELAGDNSRMLESMSAATRKLAEMAHELESEMSRFKV